MERQSYFYAVTSLTSLAVCTRIPLILPQILPPTLPVSVLPKEGVWTACLHTATGISHFQFYPHSLCLPVPVSVWDVFVLCLFVGRGRQIQVGTQHQCPKTNKVIAKLLLEQGQLDEFLELLMLHLFPGKPHNSKMYYFHISPHPDRVHSTHDSSFGVVL